MSGCSPSRVTTGNITLYYENPRVHQCRRDYDTEARSRDSNESTTTKRAFYAYANTDSNIEERATPSLSERTLNVLLLESQLDVASDDLVHSPTFFSNKYRSQKSPSPK